MSKTKSSVNTLGIDTTQPHKGTHLPLKILYRCMYWYTKRAAPNTYVALNHVPASLLGASETLTHSVLSPLTLRKLKHRDEVSCLRSLNY